MTRVLHAQIAEFDAASIKPSAGGGCMLTASPGRITFISVTLRDCLMAAYDVKYYQISAADWMRTERFDIIATAPDAPAAVIPVLSSNMRLMLQELVDQMSQMRSAEMDRPMVDNTGLKGRYDFTVTLFGTQEEMMAALNKGDL